MRRHLLLLAVFGLGARTSLTRPDPPAPPPAAVDGADALASYLGASGAAPLTVRHLTDFVGRRDAPSTLLEFSDGGRCLVRTYGSAEEAGQSPDISVATRAQIQSAAPRSRVTVYKPTYRLGPLAVSCVGEAPLVSQALQGLQASFRADA